MANTQIDSLEIKITANAQNAANALKSLSSALKSVKTQLTGMKDGAKVSTHFAESLDEMNSALNAINRANIKKLQKLSDGLNGYSDAVKKMKGIRGSIATSIKDTTKALDVPVKDGMAVSEKTTATTTANIKKVGSAAKKTSEEVKKLGEETEKVGKKVKKTAGIFGKFIKSIFRIAIYRAIRSALKSIGEAFSEGLKNAYLYSKQTEGFERLANTLDRIASITYQMKNQLGAFWGEIKQFVLPAVEWLVEKVRSIAEWLTELFAALNGSDTYLWAKYVQKSWDDAADAAEKYKHQLLGIDELNNLSAQKTTKDKDNDHSDDFEKRSVRSNWQDLGVKVKELTLEIGSIVPDFSNFTSKDLENILTIGLFGIAGAVLGGAPGAIVGVLGGILLTLGINKLESEGDKTYKKKGVYKLLKPALMSMVGGIIGIKYGGAAGALIGATAGMALGLIVQKLGKIEDLTNLSDADKWSLIKTALIGLTGGIIGFTLGGPTGAIVGASLAISLDLIFEELHVIDNIKDKITTKILDLEEEWGIDLNQDGNIGYGKGQLVTVGTKQLDDAWKPNEPSIDYSSKRITLNKIDSALKRSNTAKEILNDMSVGNAIIPAIGTTVKKIGNAISDFFTPDKKEASGGINRPGTLILAGESGPELVGSMGSSSAVANTSQMTDAIYKAAYMGMSRALAENGGNGLSGFVPATTDDLFIAMRKKASNYNKVTGNSAFA